MAIFITFILKNCLGTLLLFAGLGKVKERQTFTENLEMEFHIPSSLSLYFLIGLIFTEILLGLILLLGSHLFVTLALYLSLAMFAIFTVVVGKKLLLHQPIFCNCFGVKDEAFTYLDLLRNTLLIASCVVCLIYYYPNGFTTFDTAHGYIIGVFCAVFLINFKHLIKVSYIPGY
jgi:hypothetical protein